VEAYQTSDLFVFPSVAEGFGQVLLEAMACGLPVLSTTRTAAPDLIQEGVQGFVVEPCRPDLLAQHIEWAVGHREELAYMGSQARLRAEQFTWTHFRARVADVVQEYLASELAHVDEAEGSLSHV
jgi:glycosyltransferase involved in cell wall biosynthesis